MSFDDGKKSEAKLIPIMEVAARLGIERLQSAGRERHGPCPVSGGTDRMQISPDKNLFICRNACDAAGDQIALVQHVQGCDFQAALSFLVGDGQARIDPKVVAENKRRAAANEARRREFAERARARAIRDAREIWHAATPGAGSPAEAYLAARGVHFKEFPPTLRFIPDHPYLKTVAGKLETLHRGPCMIAAVENAGRVLAVHQTWIDPAAPGQKATIAPVGGKASPAKMVRGSKKGGVIRLTALGNSGVLVMGEGIETTGSALTAAAIPTAAYWAGVDLGNMSGKQVRVPGTRNSGLPDMADADAWIPPAGVKRLVFIQDGDSDPKATRAKLESGLRRAQLSRPGLVGEIVHPGAGKDLNDLINEREQSQ